MLNKLILSAILLFSVTLITAKPPSIEKLVTLDEIAADVILIKMPKISMTSLEKDTPVIMELDNQGAVEHKLIAAYSPIAKRVQFQQTLRDENDELSLQQVAAIAIKPHTTTKLTGGGVHIMLMGMSRQIRLGEQLPLMLLFDDGSYLNVQMPVK